MRVLVTGGDGFTGTYLVPELESRSCEVIVFDADITDPAAVQASVAAARPDRVIHLAAIAFIASDDFASFYRVNQLGTFHLLEAVARSAPEASVLLASSANIYGNATPGYLTETAPPDPANHYAVSKWAMERGAALWADRVRMTVTRPFNYTGIGQGEQFLIPKIVSHFRRREPRIQLGNLDVKRDFGDVRSVVAAYCALSLDPPQKIHAVNVCTGEVWSIRDILDMATRITGHTIEVSTDPKLVRRNEVAVLAGDPSLLKSILPEWKPRSIEETLRWMLSE